MRKPLLAVLLVVAVGFMAPARSEEGDAFARSVSKAVAKGVEYLRKAQASDGSWDYEPLLKGNKLAAALGDPTAGMKQGCTALAALALLKSGVAPEDPAIEKAFSFMRSRPVEHVYDAGCILLAIEARSHARTKTKEKAKDAKDLELAKSCAAFLVKFQERGGGWRYPLPSIVTVQREDASHPQYALLGLDAAERLGIAVPKETYERAAGFFLANQEKDGPEVAPFPVPGADLSCAELRKIEKEMLEKIKKIESDFKGKKPDQVNAAGHTQEDERRTVERAASDALLKTREKPPKIHARGWGYDTVADEGTKENNPLGRLSNLIPKDTTVTGSMTASGVTSLLLCKKHLEGSSAWTALRPQIDRAIRDGAGWLAARFSVAENPKSSRHLYYFLYGLERSGVLALVASFGTHEWYPEGAKAIVGQQKDDGRWDGGAQGTAGPVPDTCFALLFLTKGTTPLVRVPTRTATGTGGKP